MGFGFWFEEVIFGMGEVKGLGGFGGFFIFSFIVGLEWGLVIFLILFN